MLSRKERYEQYIRDRAEVNRKIKEVESEILILRSASTDTIRRTGQYADKEPLGMNQVGDFITTLKSYYERYNNKRDVIDNYEKELEELRNNYLSEGENNG